MRVSRFLFAQIALTVGLLCSRNSFAGDGHPDADHIESENDPHSEDEFNTENQDSDHDHSHHAAVRKPDQSMPALSVPDIALVVDAGFGWHFGGPRIVQGGHAIDNNGFRLQAVELAVSGTAGRWFNYSVAVEFVDFRLEEAVAFTTPLAGIFVIGAGYMSPEFGSDNNRHLHESNYINPTLSHSRFLAEEHLAGAGAALEFRIPAPWGFSIGAAVLDTHEETGFSSSSFAPVNGSTDAESDEFRDFVWISRLKNSFGPGLFDKRTSELLKEIRWGLSGAWGASRFSDNGWTSLYGTDLGFTLAGGKSPDNRWRIDTSFEYVIRMADSDSGRFLDHGGFARVDVEFKKYWAIGIRSDMTAMLSGKNPDKAELAESEWRLSASGTFRPIPEAGIRLQYGTGSRNGESVFHECLVQLELAVGNHQEGSEHRH